MTKSTDFFDINSAPLRVGTVVLKVRDLEMVATFYQAVLWLSAIETGAHRVTLGNAATPLLELVGSPALAARDPRQAGLFHTAFLMPSRADLARWVAHAAETRVPLQGASDHIVSEAIYLADPEGNGIEVYADRPVSRWRGPNGEIQMTTEHLEVSDLLREAEGTEWAGFPEAGILGHVHLQVGDTGEAERFYRDVLGFDVVSRYPGASFFGSGGYHHQLAGNTWNSLYAGRRPDGAAGLDRLEIIGLEAPVISDAVARAESASMEITQDNGGTTLRDPWGTNITLRT